MIIPGGVEEEANSDMAKCLFEAYNCTRASTYGDEVPKKTSIHIITNSVTLKIDFNFVLIVLFTSMIELDFLTKIIPRLEDDLCFKDRMDCLTQRAFWTN